MFIITDGAEISKLQSHLKSNLLNLEHEKISAGVGYQGGDYSGNVFWFEKLGFWLLSNKLDNRYWNAFGTEKPTHGASLTIACEINFPLDGISRRIAGAFAKDKNNIFITHRGIIGGGRKGIGKKLFEDNYNGDWIEVDDGNKSKTKVALVADLNSKMLGKQLRDFINEVRRIKDIRK